MRESKLLFYVGKPPRYDIVRGHFLGAEHAINCVSLRNHPYKWAIRRPMSIVLGHMWDEGPPSLSSQMTCTRFWVPVRPGMAYQGSLLIVYSSTLCVGTRRSSTKKTTKVFIRHSKYGSQGGILRGPLGTTLLTQNWKGCTVSHV